MCVCVFSTDNIKVSYNRYISTFTCKAIFHAEFVRTFKFMIIQNSTRLVTPLHSLRLQYWKLTNLYTCYLYACTRTNLHTNIVQDNARVTFYSPNITSIQKNITLIFNIMLIFDLLSDIYLASFTRRVVCWVFYLFSNVTNTLRWNNNCH